MIRSAALACLLAIVFAVPAFAQLGGGSPPERKSVEKRGEKRGEKPEAGVEIADEPRTIDPARFVAEPLRRPVTKSFRVATLEDFAEYLNDDLEIPTVLDLAELASAGVRKTDEFSGEFDETPAYLMLDQVALPLGLDWYVADGILYLTSEEAAGQRRTTRTFQVGKFYDAGYDAV